MFYGVVSSDTQKIVQFFLTREEAEAMIARVLASAPGLAGLFQIVAVEFSIEAN